MSDGFKESEGNARGAVSVSVQPALSQLLDRALGLHQAGNLSEAKALYEQILVREPEHADALHFLGVLAHQSGERLRAVELIRKAIAHSPEVGSYHNNLGNVLGAGGDLEGALESYREAMRLEPEDADARFNTGIVLQKLGRESEAEASYREALALRSDDAEFHYNLANALKAQGRLEEAVDAYRSALNRDAGSAESHNNLGNTLQRLGRLDEAIQAYRTALDLKPDDPNAYNNLGNVLLEQGEADEAVGFYERALQINPHFAEAYRNLGRAHRIRGKVKEAVEVFLQALALNPRFTGARQGLATALRFYVPVDFEPQIERELMACFESAEVHHQDIAPVTINQLKHKHRIPQRLQSCGDDKRSLIAEVTSDRLLHQLLAKTVNVDRELELLLAQSRRPLLFDSVDADRIPEPLIAVIAAFGQQCFSNEYVFCTQPDEDETVASIAYRVEQACEAEVHPSSRLERDILLLAMYRSPGSLACAGALADVSPEEWSASVRPLIQRTVNEPLEEKTLATHLPSIGEVEDPTSQAVRAQYEENPYPRWLDLPSYGTTTLGVSLRRRFPHFNPPAFLDGTTRVLVPGCGTGQEPIAIARTRDNVQILAVDLSKASLAYGSRMARKLGVKNVQFMHGDILELGRLDGRFDVIECVAVLHHMEEPMAGWRILAGLLRPGGVMRVGLYSERARTAIVAARAYIQEHGLTPSSRDIRAFRSNLLTRNSDPVLFELTDSEDFYTLSACRDLVFHAREHHFNLLQIKAILKEIKLGFIGFDLSDPRTRNAYLIEFPEDGSMTDLMKWDQFEARHTHAFSGLYRFWCQNQARH